MNTVLKHVRRYWNGVLNSIAFYPAIISLGFILVAVVMLYFDFSPAGKHLKSNLSWLSLKDASTARSVVSSIAAGVISLTVFSFSMVMIVLNQAAAQMSNRILDIMIGNRFQQIVLGIYLGTIVYALFLLSTIRDVQSGIYVAAISIYLLVVFMVVDIFLFIYFIHYVTQTVKYETIIRIIHDKTIDALKKQNHGSDALSRTFKTTAAKKVKADETGYFQGFNKKPIMAFAKENNVVIEFLYPRGSYLLKGTDMILVHGKSLNEEATEKLLTSVDFYEGQSIEVNPYYGFEQLSEVAVKALSPGINDGATAVSSIHALSDLLAYYIEQPTSSAICSDDNDLCIIACEKNFEELFRDYIFPVWHYGKEDPFVHKALHASMDQLKQIDVNNNHSAILNKMMIEIEKRMKENELPV